GGLHGVRSFRTVAKQVDIQAQVEKASSATVGVLTGPGAFIHAGLLSIDEIFSPVQLIIDCELAKYLTRLAKGLEFTEDQIELSIETIARCALKGQYLTDETTLKDYRRIYWTPEIFDYSLLHTYKPGLDIIAKAKKICKEKIQTHRYQLEDERRKKLEEIYREAVKTLS
ncbi:MAG: trimethylamine methyltransferase family protein, partial [Candidatus Bathyarchaeia archaeon]